MRPRINRSLRAMCVGLLYLAYCFWTQAQTQPNAVQPCPKPGFAAQPWLEDFHELLREMSEHYADLEYAVEGRHMDMPQLRRETEQKLSVSCDEHEARRALQSFLGSFGDGRLEIVWSSPSPNATDTKPADAASLCIRLGYEKKPLNPGIDFGQLPEFTSIGGDGADRFPGGILTLSENQKLGVIRIPIFGERWFPEVCEQAVGKMHLENPETCDQKCKKEIQYATGDLLTAMVVKRSKDLQSAGASAFLVDVTQNEGGSDWVDPVLRSFSSIPLQELPWGFIKHQHWTEELQKRLSDVEADIKNQKEPRDLLQLAATRLRSGIALSQEKCDRTSVWTDGKLTCSLVVSGLLFSSGVLPYAAPGSLAALQSQSALFHPLDYAYTESSARPRLYVVVDSHTWSSAEYFAFMLQDNNAATILGEVTGGAGCGFTNGGIPTQLKNSHAMVKMPDCIHFRKDGSNANAGVTPDLLVPWSAHDSPYLRARKLYSSLVAGVTQGPKEASHEAH